MGRCERESVGLVFRFFPHIDCKFIAVYRDFDRALNGKLLSLLQPLHYSSHSFNARIPSRLCIKSINIFIRVKFIIATVEFDCFREPEVLYQFMLKLNMIITESFAINFPPPPPSAKCRKVGKKA